MPDYVVTNASNWIFSTTTATVTLDTTSTAWSAWTNGTTNNLTYTVLTDSVWGNWADQTTVYRRQTTYRPPVYEPPTAESIAEQAEAKRRAEVILRENLTPTQIRALDRWGYFRVVAGSGRTYRIERGTSGNVKSLDVAGKPTARFCIHPAGVPAADTMLAQKLLLETDEEAFLRIANRSAA